jgi:RimJ/RimL family protein N-acetyltransferase
MIKGALVRLREPKEEDVDHVAQWVQHEDFQLFLMGDPLIPRQNLKEVLLRQINSPSNYDAVVNLIIETKRKGEPIGLVRFHSISWKSRIALIETFIAEDKQNLPYGPDALLTAARYAFHELNLRKICMHIFAYNKRSLHVAERSSAKKETVLRKHIYRQGKYHDVYSYGIFREDFEKLLEQLKGTFLGG